MKVWLTFEKNSWGDRVMLWFDKPEKIYDPFIKRECWSLSEDSHFYYPNLTLSDVNYLVNEENSPLELDIQFLNDFIVKK